MATRDFYEYKKQSLECDVADAQEELDTLQKELQALPGYDKYYETFKNGIIIVKLVKCGNPNCCCRTKGILHGPYVYFQYAEDGKTHQKYLKRNEETDKVVDIVRKNQEVKKAIARRNKAVAKLNEFTKQRGVEV